MADKKNSIYEKLKKLDILAGILVSVCFAFMIGIYAPYELFLTNRQDFWFTGSDLILPTLTLFFVVLILGIIIYTVADLINRKLYYLLLSVGVVATVATYIQGTFLVNGLPAMDGTEYDWSQPSPERIKTIVTWAVLIIAVIFLCFKFRSKALKTVASFASVAIVFMLTTSFISIVITNYNAEIRDNYDSVLTCSDKNLYQMSSNQNLVIIVLDAVDNTSFREVINNDPDYADTFEDFTYFNNTLSGYVFTRESFPFILSGEWYENDEDYFEYQNRVISESPLINALEEKNYSTGLYASFNQRLKYDASGKFENFIEDNPCFADIVISLKVVIRMAGIRYAPWDMKQEMYKLDWTVQVSRAPSMDYNYYNCNNEVFYKAICKNAPFDIVDQKICRIIHLDGAHAPFKYDKNMDVLTDGSATYTSSVEACATICDEYIATLKENGTYDNTAIVIISDHGYFPYSTPEEHVLVGRTNPILIVKGIDERHEMAMSEAPISQVDYAKAFVQLLEGKSSNEIFEYNENDVRERRVMVYGYTQEHHMKEYVTTGRADDIDLLIPTGEEYILSN